MHLACLLFIFLGLRSARMGASLCDAHAWVALQVLREGHLHGVHRFYSCRWGGGSVVVAAAARVLHVTLDQTVSLALGNILALVKALFTAAKAEEHLDVLSL